MGKLFQSYLGCIYDVISQVSSSFSPYCEVEDRGSIGPGVCSINLLTSREGASGASLDSALSVAD